MRGDSGLSEADGTEIGETLREVFPQRIRDYLFDAAGRLRSDVFDVSRFGRLLERHESDLLEYLELVFGQSWPDDDRDVVARDALSACLRETGSTLQEVVRTLKRRLDWALRQIQRLEAERRLRGTLEPDEDALFTRCDRLVKRYKGLQTRRRSEAAGHDDTNTYNVLASEGFLPGYGLETGAIVATALVPRQLGAGSDFDLPRPPAVALREYVPGNLIYANGHRFVPRFFHLRADEAAAPAGSECIEPVLFHVDIGNEAVREIGTATDDVAALGATALKAVPVCDVDLSHVSHISDDEEYRFQLPVKTLGYEQGRHGPGRAWRWGDRDVLKRRNVHFRLVNVGAMSLIQNQQRLGYPICLVCGQSRSPFSSDVERDAFANEHRERCGCAVESAGFFADVVADAISIPGCATPEEAYSIAEALRAGAADVLDMDREDLEVLVLRQPGSAEATAVLYDPMSGGSGLLDQFCERFVEVAQAALTIVRGCPSRCPRACADCLFTFRNAFFHRHLNRHLVESRLIEWGSGLTFVHEVPARLPMLDPSPADGPAHEPEARLRRMLLRAGFPEPDWHKVIDLGRPLGRTAPDCYFAGDDDGDYGTCIYLDGLSSSIHGNPATRERDRQIREQLRGLGYAVFEIAASQLDDRGAMARHFYRLGQVLVGKEKARDLRDRMDWFE